MRALLTLLLLALLPASAPGATASSTVSGGERSVGFTGEPGERNAPQIEEAGLEVILRDAVALRPSGDCVAVDPRTVRCPGTRHVLSVDLGDGDDVWDGPVRVRSVAGGDGDDRLAGPSHQIDGGPGADAITGGDGDDVLIGGAGADVIRGGGGDDGLFDGERFAFAADVLDGGDGHDRVHYSHRSAAVHVDLAAGFGAEGDRLAGIEGAGGGQGADVLRGDGGPNTLFGGAGRDLLEGRDGDDLLDGQFGADVLRGEGGADRLFGGEGSDALDGGAGEDVLGPEEAGTDRYACGAGLDLVWHPGASTRVRADCEEQALDLGDSTLRGANWLSRSGSVARLALRCVRGPCAARYELRLPGGRLLARARFAKVPVAGLTLSLPMRRTVLRRLRGRRGAALILIARDRHGRALHRARVRLP